MVPGKGRARFWSLGVADVEIYTTPICPYCIRAKALLDKKGVAYKEVNVMVNPGKREDMVQRSGGRKFSSTAKPSAAATNCSNWISTAI